ncbi:TetR/AcrR family transcriptional regulator [Metabacillus idriensis]|uniref:TetR/AcrR family transcriptional regulator n=1 Tax=Metabacillus idriensis TaxID=324768 RepID=UPI00174D48D3|nr:TetR/AcrR family transcriptional regulator [Metabacillus idriensis]
MTDSFIAETRREQMILACIDKLEEVGYNSLSLSKVAKKAGISTELISYHLDDKLDLIKHTLHFLIKTQLDFISSKVLPGYSATNQLEAFIEAYLAYQDIHFKSNIALLEIVFNARNEEGVPYYRLEDETEENPLRTLLVGILKNGQKRENFIQSFHPEIAASFILGAIEERMLKANSSVPVEHYSDELIKMMKKLIAQ